MKRTKFISFLVVGLIAMFAFTNVSNGQSHDSPLYPKVFDRFGAEYPLKSLQVIQQNDVDAMQRAVAANAPLVIPLTACNNNSYFDYYIPAIRRI